MKVFKIVLKSIFSFVKFCCERSTTEWGGVDKYFPSYKDFVKKSYYELFSNTMTLCLKSVCLTMFPPKGEKYLLWSMFEYATKLRTTMRFFWKIY